MDVHILINWMIPFQVLGMWGGIDHFYSNFKAAQSVTFDIFISKK